MPQKDIQTVQDAPKPELAESESPKPESGSDEDHEIEPEQQLAVLESKSEFTADIGPAEHDYMLSEGLADIPDESVVDTESSDGWGLGFEDKSEGDHEKDEDYVMDSCDGDKGSDGEFSNLHDFCEPTKKLGKAKAVKVSPLFYPS